MSVRRLSAFAVAVATLSLVACGGTAAPLLNSYKEAKLENAEDAKLWISSASAPAIFASSMLPIMLVEIARQGTNADMSCPVVTTEGSKTTYKGGCTDKQGRKWLGTAISDGGNREQRKPGRLTYQGFGFESTETCNGQNVTTSTKFEGTIEGKADASNSAHYDIRMDIAGVDKESCATMSETIVWLYDGMSTSENNRQTWNGSGTIGRAKYGKVAISTKDEVIDSNACNEEALSGSTTLKSGNNTIVVTYDGATDCEESSTAQWSLNGQAQGELTGVSCSAAGGGAMAAWGALATAALALLRRRRR